MNRIIARVPFDWGQAAIDRVQAAVEAAHPGATVEVYWAATGDPFEAVFVTTDGEIPVSNPPRPWHVR